jgi:aminocarboxymuconate-semialdehyde decarboxylase
MRIDVHAHLLPPDLPDWRRRTGETRAVDDSYWSIERRTELLDELGIDVQVLSPLPPLLPWWTGDATEAREWCRAVNEAIAAAVAAGGGRFRGLGIVPLQDTDLAAAELARIRDLGLVGVEVGTAVDDERTFADASVDGFLAACAAAGLSVLVHPNRPNPYGTMHPALDTGVWRTSDTALVMGERLLRAPDAPAGLRVCLAHGGGSLLWQWPRLTMSTDLPADLPGWISVDTAGCTARQVDYLIDAVGADRVLLGTDLPAGRRLAIEEQLAGMALR